MFPAHYRRFSLRLSLLCTLLTLPRLHTLCPHKCTCNRHRVTCRDTGLRSVPIFLDPRMRRLDLANNTIGDIPTSALHFYKRLTWLHLNNNKLRTISVLLLNKNALLTNLRLDSNRLTHLESHTFKGLTHLKVLNLSSNYISSLSNETFYGLRNLVELRLASNRLKTFHDEVFVGLSSLKLLDLSGNLLLEFGFGIAIHLNTLNFLKLSSNKLTKVTLPRAVVSVDLSRNYLTRVSFNHLPSSLLILNLGFNPLISVSGRKSVNVSDSIWSHTLSYPLHQCASTSIDSVINHNIGSVTSDLKFPCQESFNGSFAPTQSHTEIPANQLNYSFPYNQSTQMSLVTSHVSQSIKLKYLNLRQTALTHLPNLTMFLQMETEGLTLDLRQVKLRCDCSLIWLQNIIKSTEKYRRKWSILTQYLTCSNHNQITFRRVDLSHCQSRANLFISIFYSNSIIIVSVTFSGLLLVSRCIYSNHSRGGIRSISSKPGSLHPEYDTEDQELSLCCHHDQPCSLCVSWPLARFVVDESDFLRSHYTHPVVAYLSQLGDNSKNKVFAAAFV